MSFGETDELGFGDDREPWLPAWIEAHRRLLTIVAAAAVLVAGLGAGGWYLYERSNPLSAPPDVPLPGVDGVEITLCQGYRVDDCAPVPPDVVTNNVRTHPELTSVTLISKEEAARRGGESMLLSGGLTLDFMSFPAHIRAKLRDRGDFATIKRRLEASPGILQVVEYVPDFWSGKANLAVMLCGRQLHLGTCRGSSTTQAQRDAVVARLGGQDGVEEIFLEDRPFAMRLAQHRFPRERFTVAQFSETLYVRLDDPAKARAAGQAVLDMPGVGWARLVE